MSNQQADKNSHSTMREYWIKHLGLWERSGLTQAQYCKKHQLNFNSFKNWKYKLKQKTLPKTLLPVSVIPDIPPQPKTINSGILLSFGDKYRVELETNFDSDTLSQLLDLLERR